MNYARKIDEGSYRRNQDDRRPKNRLSVQDFILGRCKRRSIPLEVTLKNEQKAEGTILAYDNWTIYLETSQGSILIFKSGILCLRPKEPLTQENVLSYPPHPDPRMAETGTPYRYRDRAERRIA